MGIASTRGTIMDAPSLLLVFWGLFTSSSQPFAVEVPADASEQTPPDDANAPRPDPSFADPLVVTAARAEQRLTDAVAPTTVLTREDLARSPGLTLDDQLRQVPGFSLLRRSSSLTAHPTSQG